MSGTAPADAARVLGLINAFRHSKAMFTATSLGVFDALDSSPMTASQLAARLETHAGALERLLNACAYLGLVVKNDAVYSNAPAASRYLVSASPDTLSGYVVYSDQSLYPLWGNLGQAIRDGSNRWEQTFGNRNALFDQFFRDEHAKRSFLQGMHGLGQLTSPALVRAFDLSRFRRWVDLGGATGHLCIAACEAYPELEATVFDLPAVEEIATQHLAASPAATRLRFVAGDFFQNELPPADLYSLGRILHDWGPERIARLLTRIFRALPPGGALLVAEAVLDDDHTGPEYAVMQSLNMLVCTEGGERSNAEYRALLQEAGFATVDFRRTGTALDAILATKAADARPA
jgi:acetylserotonin N-methyltransferase